MADAARNAEAAGISTLWFPEHVVFVKGATSQYPYGTLRMGERPGVYDPIIAMTVAATVTSKVRLGTGVLILPQREPLTLAQQLVALDHASTGRLDLGIGVGWLHEEFDALGATWERRGERTDDYVDVLRKLWRDDVVDHHSDFVDIDGVLAWPKPAQADGIPIWVGGNSPAALRRTAKLGDGWFGWSLEIDEVTNAVTRLRAECEAIGRDPAEVRLKVGQPGAGSHDERRAYAEGLMALGVEEFIVASGDVSTERLASLAALGSPV